MWRLRPLLRRARGRGVPNGTLNVTHEVCTLCEKGERLLVKRELSWYAFDCRRKTRSLYLEKNASPLRLEDPCDPVFGKIVPPDAIDLVEFEVKTVALKRFRLCVVKMAQPEHVRVAQIPGNPHHLLCFVKIANRKREGVREYLPDPLNALPISEVLGLAGRVQDKALHCVVPRRVF